MLGAFQAAQLMPFAVANEPVEVIAYSTMSESTTMSYPTGTQPGDLVIVMGGSNDDNPAAVDPSDFTSGGDVTGAYVVGTWSWQIVPDPVPSNISGLLDDNQCVYLAATLRNADQTNPIESFTMDPTYNATSLPDPPEHTAGSGGLFWLFLGWLDREQSADVTSAPSTPSGTSLIGAADARYITVMMAGYQAGPTESTINPGAFDTETNRNVTATIAIQ